MPLPIPFPLPLGSGAVDPTPGTGIVTPGDPSTYPIEAARLAQYIKDKQNMLNLLAVASVQVDEVTQMFAALDVDMRLDAAYGVNLDLLGTIVGQPRTSADDDLYRNEIRARIKLNNCSGTVEEIYEIFTLIINGDQVLRLREYPPASFILEAFAEDGITADEATQQGRFLQSAKAAGVKTELHYSVAPLAETFRFDTGPGFDEGHLAGSV